MTRHEFIELHRHQIAGLVLDAATAGRSGAELSQWLKLAMGKIDQQLGRVWESVHEKPAVPNGKPEPPRRDVAVAVHRG